MERLIFLEVLDRRGQVRQRQRLEAFPCRVGRGYDNDIILDDVYVSPSHLEISFREDGGLELRDLDSDNGVRLGERHLRGDACVAPLPCEFRLGRTRCRLRDTAHPVAPTLRDGADIGLGRRLQQPWLGAVLLAAVLAVSASSTLRDMQQRNDWGHLAEELLSTGLVLAVWVGLWALITRVLTPRTRFLAHWIIAALYTLFEAAQEWAGAWLRFFVAPITPVQAFEIATALVVATGVFWAHISLTGALRGARRALLAAALAAVFVALNQLDTVFRRPDWVQVLPYWSRLQPVDPRWLPTTPVDQFLAGTETLRGRLDAAALDARAARAHPAATPVLQEDTP